MKILLVTSFFPPTHTAGTENYTFGIARGLVQAGNQVRVICAGKWAEGEHYWNGYTDEIYKDVPVRRLHLNWSKATDPNRYLYDNPVVSAQVIHYLDGFKPQVVHITSCLTLSASVIRAVKQAKIPVIVTLTDFWFLCPRINLLRSDSELCDGRTTPAECLRCMLRDAKIYNFSSQVLPQSTVDKLLLTVSQYSFLTRWRGLRGMALDMKYRKTYLRETLAMADCVIAPSNALKDFFLRNDFHRSIRVLQYGHDLSWLQAYKEKKQSDSIRFGYLGQIIPIKGVHLVLQAFKSIPSDSLATLSVFGDLNKDLFYTEQLERIASDCSKIQFKSAFVREHLGQVLGSLDVVVVPSIWYENNPLVIQEAFAARIPVITTNLGGMSEFVKHEVNGLLFERGNVQDLASQLQRVINEPSLLECLRAGIPPVKKIEEEIHELERLYWESIQTAESDVSAL